MERPVSVVSFQLSPVPCLPVYRDLQRGQLQAGPTIRRRDSSLGEVLLAASHWEVSSVSSFGLASNFEMIPSHPVAPPHLFLNFFMVKQA